MVRNIVLGTLAVFITAHGGGGGSTPGVIEDVVDSFDLDTAIVNASMTAINPILTGIYPER